MATPDAIALEQPRCLAALRRCSVVVVVMALAMTACSSDRPHNADRASIRGRARLNGKVFDTRFIGAVVMSGGLVTPCNVTIPTVVAGRFALDVYGEKRSAGCGRRGSRVVLWVYSGAQQIFATKALNWPTGGAATVSADFSTADPSGAAPRLLELSGEVHRADGSRVPAGARVEAFIGDTLCGVASVRSDEGFDGYILHVVGPNSIPGCRTGGTITFRVDGAPTNETISNGGTPPRQFDLTLR